MVNVCVCAGCTNSCLSGHRVHRFPQRKNPAFRAWVKFVQVRRQDFPSSSVSSNSVICGFHFREEDYLEGDITQHKMGFRKKDQIRLKSTAVPSVRMESNKGKEHSLGSAAAPSTTMSAPSCDRRHSRASHKLDVARTPEVKTTEGTPEAAGSPPETPGDVKDDCLSHQRHSSTRVNHATRCGYRQSISHSCPEPIDEQDDGLKPFEDSELISIDDSFPVDVSLEDNIDCQNDEANKSIVCQEELLQLFSTCVCGERAEATVTKKSGTFIEIQQKCDRCGHRRSWQNQPMLHRNMPACNILLSEWRSTRLLSSTSSGHGFQNRTTLVQTGPPEAIVPSSFIWEGCSDGVHHTRGQRLADVSTNDAMCPADDLPISYIATLSAKRSENVSNVQ